MTDLLHEKSFSRTAFVKGGGALIVGFTLAGAGLAGKAEAALSPFGSNVLDQSAVDTWLVIYADNTALIKSGAIQQGTGSDTGILQIAGDELNMNMSQLSNASDDTSVTPNTGPKSASNTIAGSAGLGIRAAAATAYQALLGMASTKLGVPVSSLSVSGGVVSGGGQSVTYGDLIGGRLFNVEMPGSYNLQNAGVNFGFSGGLAPGVAPAKPVSEYTLVGTSPPRVDIPGIVTGTMTYIQNVVVPGMLHGRVVRPRGQPVYGFGAPVVSVDASSVAHIPGARVVQRENFLGVVAPLEYNAIQAAATLKVAWADAPAVLPGSGDEFAGMRELDSAGKSIQTVKVAGNVDQALASAAHVVAQSYGFPTSSHTPIGPACAIADVTPQGARILAGTQGAYITQQSVFPVLGVPQDNVRVSAVAMGGCYGGGQQYDEAAQAAAVMSQIVGAPVRVQLMRWDEIGWDNTGPGTLMDIRAGIDGNGNIVGFDFTQFYPQYKGDSVNDPTSQLVGATSPGAGSASGTGVPTTPYNIRNTRTLVKSLPLVGNWIQVDWMRNGSNPHVTFAGEQVIDELAHAANMDPVAFRQQNVVQDANGANTQAQWLAVLDAVTEAANWQPKVAASDLSDANIVTGRGVSWGSTGAAIADISVNKKTGKITVQHIYQAFSAGLSVNPGLVQNQMVGGITQITSRLLVEQYRYTKTNVTSLDFVTYPIMRMMDSPKVTAIVVQHTNLKPTGVGEPVTTAAPGAIANAFFDATGVRLLTAPFTPERVKAALAAAGQGTAGTA